MTYHRRTIEAAKGHWKGILLELGIPENALTGKHAPCPLCTSRDNFRWDNKDGSGSYICTCSSGYGMTLAEAFTGQQFKDVASRIDALLGNVTPDTAAPKPEMTEQQRREALKTLWRGSAPIEKGDLADTYLHARGIGELIYPPALRYARAVRDGEGGVRPCMVAAVGVYGAPKFATMHRTFLRPDGKAKAEMAAPRKLMPGPLPDGACVQLSDYHGGPLGISTGIETAMSASALYDLPVWAAINDAMLEKWWPPKGCEEVAIFGDNDESYSGQAATYALAKKLKAKGIAVTDHIPPARGEDWNDFLLKGGK